MSSNTLRTVRRKKSSLSEVKIAVLGATAVGKSAITVRFLTKRFIGEYEHKTENHYKNEIPVDGETIIFEIIDTCNKEDVVPRDETLQWADGYMLVYSITDRNSFNEVQALRQHIGQHCRPVILVANKADLIHLRQVSTEEGEIFAKEWEDSFAELSASEHVTQVADAFYELSREVHAFRRRSRHSLLDRVLGNKTSGRK